MHRNDSSGWDLAGWKLPVSELYGTDPQRHHSCGTSTYPSHILLPFLLLLTPPLAVLVFMNDFTLIPMTFTTLLSGDLSGR
jgi:hypothetical protein